MSELVTDAQAATIERTWTASDGKVVFTVERLLATRTALIEALGGLCAHVEYAAEMEAHSVAFGNAARLLARLHDEGAEHG